VRECTLQKQAFYFTPGCIEMGDKKLSTQNTQHRILSTDFYILSRDDFVTEIDAPRNKVKFFIIPSRVTKVWSIYNFEIMIFFMIFFLRTSHKNISNFMRRSQKKANT